MNPDTPANPAPHAPAPRGALLAVGLGAGIDLALTLALLARGWTQGGAHIAGFAAGTLAALLIAAWAGRAGRRPALRFHGLRARAGGRWGSRWRWACAVARWPACWPGGWRPGWP